MSIISRLTTWTIGQVLKAADLNGEFSNITNVLNNLDAGTTTWTIVNGTTSTITNLTATSATITTLGHGSMKYRRPNLQYSSSTVVNLETGINGTSGAAQILFPDGSLRTDSTSGHINCNLAQVAALTGTAQSGLQTGAVSNNTWYAVYAVKSQVNSTDFVTVADKTNFPVQASFATLNSNFGTNSWVYLGLIRYGDNSGTANAILLFYQSGPMTVFNNVCVGTSINSMGIRLATTASAASVTYTYASGSGAAQIPAYLLTVDYGGYTGTGSAATAQIEDQSTTISYGLGNQANGFGMSKWVYAGHGFKIATAAASATDVYLHGWIDPILAAGVSPLL